MGTRIRITDQDRSSKDELHTAQKAVNFLFDLGSPPEGETDLSWHEGANLSAKTRVKGAQTMAALAYYDVLAQAFKCRAALHIGNALKHLLIADVGKGREEATTVARGKLPKEIEIPVGSDEL